jgi:hypothetical protein
MKLSKHQLRLEMDAERGYVNYISNESNDHMSGIAFRKSSCVCKSPMQVWKIRHSRVDPQGLTQIRYRNLI